jgi:hypothetical protein
MAGKGQLAALLLGGYLLGRTKKMRLALTLAAAVGGSRVAGQAGGGNILGRINGLVESSPQAKALVDQVMTTLAQSAKTAAIAGATRGVENINTRLQSRIGQPVADAASTAGDTAKGASSTAGDTAKGAASTAEDTAGTASDTVTGRVPGAGGSRKEPEPQQDDQTDEGQAADEAPADEDSTDEAPPDDEDVEDVEQPSEDEPAAEAPAPKQPAQQRSAPRASGNAGTRSTSSEQQRPPRQTSAGAPSAGKRPAGTAPKRPAGSQSKPSGSSTSGHRTAGQSGTRPTRPQTNRPPRPSNTES